MLLFPAIDLMSGQVVRLRQGKAGEKTVYSNNPVEFAQKWAQSGDWLHLVDLDAAFSGTSQNLEAVRKITSSVPVPCELGGGMRSEQAIERAFEAGVARVVIGTRATESVDFVAQMSKRFGPDRIAVGIDAKNGIVSIKGWTESSGLRATDLALRVQEAGAGTIIYTDIATDGMMEGPNFAELENLMGVLRCQLIASGGVSNEQDLHRLAAIPGLYGAIIGKALYEKTVDLSRVAQALKQ